MLEVTPRNEETQYSGNRMSCYSKWSCEKAVEDHMKDEGHTAGIPWSHILETQRELCIYNWYIRTAGLKIMVGEICQKPSMLMGAPVHNRRTPTLPIRGLAVRVAFAMLHCNQCRFWVTVSRVQRARANTIEAESP